MFYELLWPRGGDNPGKSCCRVAHAELVDGTILGAPLRLEVGLRVKGKFAAPVVPGQGFEVAEERELFPRPLEVAFVIGFEEELPARDEDLAPRVQEGALDETTAVVPGLGPGIGEEKVEPAHGGVREEPFDGVACFQAQHLQVAETSLRSPPANPAHAPQEALDGEEVPVRELTGHLEDKGAVPASEIDLKRGVLCEQLVRREPAEIIPGNELSRFSRARRQIHGCKLRPNLPRPNPESLLPWRLTRSA